MHRGPPASEGAARELATLLHDLSHAVSRTRCEDVLPLPLTAAGWDATRAAVEQPGATVAQLAVKLGEQVSDVSGLVRELTARGLVTRWRDGTDKRFSTCSHRGRGVGKEPLEAAWGRRLDGALGSAPAGEAERLLGGVPRLRPHARSLVGSAGGSS